MPKRGWSPPSWRGKSRCGSQEICSRAGCSGVPGGAGGPGIWGLGLLQRVLSQGTGPQRCCAPPGCGATSWLGQGAVGIGILQKQRPWGRWGGGPGDQAWLKPCGHALSVGSKPWGGRRPGSLEAGSTNEGNSSTLGLMRRDGALSRLAGTRHDAPAAGACSHWHR